MVQDLNISIWVLIVNDHLCRFIFGNPIPYGLRGVGTPPIKSPYPNLLVLCSRSAIPATVTQQ